MGHITIITLLVLCIALQSANLILASSNECREITSIQRTRKTLSHLSSVDLAQELAEEEAINYGPQKRGGLSSWLAGHLKTDSKGSRSSGSTKENQPISDAGAHGIFMTGDPYTHASAVRATVNTHARFAQHAVYVTIDCSLEMNPLVQFANVVRDMKVDSNGVCHAETGVCRLPFTIVYVNHVESMGAADLSVFLRFIGSTQCDVPDLNLYVYCPRVLFVFSGSFANSVALDANTLEGYRYQSARNKKKRDADTGTAKSIENVEVESLSSSSKAIELTDDQSIAEYLRGKRDLVITQVWQEVRSFWGHRQDVYAQLRRRLKPHVVFGNPSATDASRVMQVLDRSRELQFEKQKGQTKAAQKGQKGRGSWMDSIDLDIFDRAGFVGQAQAVRLVRKALRTVKFGLKTGAAPVVFLLAGPPGTGKTFLAELIGRAYHGGLPTSDLLQSSKYVSIPMGNYQSAEDVDGFVSPRSGLQGEGILTQIFAHESRPVIVLDEIEKAHPELIKTMLLPLLEEGGTLTSKKDTEAVYPTQDAVFVLTTNCLDDVVDSLAKQMGGGLTEESYENIAGKFEFELLNRQHCKGRTEGDLSPLRNNPFKQGEPLDRRLKGGHRYSSKHGFILFMPNTRESLAAVVDNAMNAVHRQYHSKFVSAHKKGGDGNYFISGMYWTPAVRKQLLRNAEKQFSIAASTTSLVVSNVHGELGGALTTAMDKQFALVDRTKEHRAVVFVDKYGKLDARLFVKVDVEEGGIAQWTDIVADVDDNCLEYVKVDDDDDDDFEEGEDDSGTFVQKLLDEDASFGGVSSDEMNNDRISGGGGDGGQNGGASLAFEYDKQEETEEEFSMDEYVDSDEFIDVSKEWALTLSPEYQTGFALAASTLLMLTLLVATFKMLAVAALLSQAIAVLSVLSVATLVALVLLFGWKYVLTMALKVLSWVAYYLIKFGWPVLLPGSIIWIGMMILSSKQTAKAKRSDSDVLSRLVIRLWATQHRLMLIQELVNIQKVTNIQKRDDMLEMMPSGGDHGDLSVYRSTSKHMGGTTKTIGAARRDLAVAVNTPLPF